MGDVDEVFRIAPNLVEVLEEDFALRHAFLGDQLRKALFACESQSGRIEFPKAAVQAGLQFWTFDVQEVRHAGHSVAVGLESDLGLHPFGAFLGDGALVELVAKAQLELSTAQLGFAHDVGDVEFAALLDKLLLDEGGGGEDEPQLFDGRQLLLQCFEGVDGKHGSRDAHFASRLERFLEVFA